jgi:uncharacterized membrane protein
MSPKNRLFSALARHKYKAATFFMLAAASIFCVALVIARMAYSGTQQYRGLVWNLFLAWIPFALAYLAYMLSWRRWLIFVVIPLFAFLWLLFFPNAPYILTDLQHLGETVSKVAIWYDVIMLIWFSWTGMLLGIVSLNLMQEIIKRHFNRWLGWIFVFVVAGLSSAGVYIGRFIRVNSWDIFHNPTGTAEDLWSWLQDPSLRSVGFISLYTLFFLFVYFTFYTFGHILQEGGTKET